MRPFQFFAALGLLAVGPLARAQTYTVDEGHSKVAFTVRLAGRPVHGSFQGFTGKVMVSAGGKRMQVEATVAVSTIDTANVRRDAHLRTADYFAAATFPEMKFAGEGVVSERGQPFKLEGQLTIKGRTKPVVLEVHQVAGAQAPHWTATARVNRKDFGVEHHAFADLAIGDEVNIDLEIQAR